MDILESKILINPTQITTIFKPIGGKLFYHNGRAPGQTQWTLATEVLRLVDRS